MTKDELFESMQLTSASASNELIIDPVTREITIPESEKIFGVESDEKTERKYFRCKRIVGDNVDLSKYGIRINYHNANGEEGQFLCSDIAVDGDDVTFSWLLHRHVTEYKGDITFILCAVKVSSDATITNEWNTTLAVGKSLVGLEVGKVPVEQPTKDVIQQLLDITNKTSADAVKNVKIAKDESIKAIQTEGTTQVGNVKAEGTKQQGILQTQVEGIKAEREQIESNLEYMKNLAVKNTVKGKVFNVSDSSEFPLIDYKIFGESIQDEEPTVDKPIPIVSKTLKEIRVTGKNILDVSKAHGVGEATLELNEDGTITFNGTVNSNHINFYVNKQCKFLKNGITYTMSSGFGDGIQKVYLQILEKNKLTGKEKYYYTQTGAITLTVDKDINDYTLTIQVGTVEQTGNLDNFRTYFQIEIGDKATEFEPYKEQVVALSQPITLRGLKNENGNVMIDGQKYISDVLMKRDGVWGVEINLERKTKNDIAESYIVSNPIDKGDYIRVALSNLFEISNMFGTSATQNCISTVLQGVSFKDLRQLNKECICTWQRRVDFAIKKSRLSALTPEAFKQWLSSQNFELIFLIESKFKPLPAADQQVLDKLHTFYPNTVIVTDEPVEQELTYAEDTKLYIDSKIKELQTPKV